MRDGTQGVNPLTGLTPDTQGITQGEKEAYPPYDRPRSASGVEVVGGRGHTCAIIPPSPASGGGGNDGARVCHYPPRPRLRWRSADGRRGLCFFIPLRYA